MHRLALLVSFCVLLLTACTDKTPPPPAPTVAPPVPAVSVPLPPPAQARPASDSGTAPPAPAKQEDPIVVGAADHASVLTTAVQDFVIAKGRMPRDLNELVTATIISKVPLAPPSYKYVIDPASRSVKAVKK